MWQAGRRGKAGNSERRPPTLPPTWGRILPQDDAPKTTHQDSALLSAATVVGDQETANVELRSRRPAYVQLAVDHDLFLRVADGGRGKARNSERPPPTSRSIPKYNRLCGVGAVVGDQRIAKVDLQPRLGSHTSIQAVGQGWLVEWRRGRGGKTVWRPPSSSTLEDFDS